MAAHKHAQLRVGHLIAFAIRKYGWPRFRVVELEIVDQREADDAEKFWIQYLRTEARFGGGYNVSPGGDVARIISQDTRTKIRDALKGRPKSDAVKAKIRATMLGVKHAPERTMKQIAAVLGRPGHGYNTRPNATSFRKGCVSPVKGRVAVIIDGRVRKIPREHIDPLYVDVGVDVQ